MKHSTHLTDKQLIGYTQLTLSDAQRETMNQHLAACDECRERLAKLEALEHHIRHQLALEIKKAQPPSQLTFAEVRARATQRFDISSLWTNTMQVLSAGIGVALIAVLAFALVTLFQEVNQPLGPSESDSEIDPAITVWLRENVFRIATLEPHANDDFHDLLSFSQIIGDARIVALGESSYGTRDFTLLKHRMLRFMAEELGFRAVAIDLPWADAVYLDEYINTGRGFPSAVLDGSTTFGWNLNETLELLEWLRAYNRTQSAAAHVHLYGIDTSNPFRAFTNLVRYFVISDSNNYFITWSNFDCLISNSLALYYTTPSDEQNVCRAKLQDVKDRLTNYREQYVQRSSQAEYEFALRNIESLLWAESYYRQTDAAQAEAMHDRAMADEAQRLIDQLAPDDKIVIWAHNDHIANLVEGSVTRMGNFLRRANGAALVSIGFVLNQGTLHAYSIHDRPTALSAFQTNAPSTFDLSPAPAGSFEWYAHSSELPAFILDLRQSSDASWLNRSLPMRSVHDTYFFDEPDSYFVPYDLPRAFDAIVYIDQALPEPPHKLPDKGS